MRDERVYFGTEGGTFFAIEINEQNPTKSRVIWTYRDETRGQPIRSAADARARFTRLVPGAAV